MPYIVLKKNGRAQKTPFVFTQVEIARLARDNACYVVQNTTTYRKSRIGGACRRGGKIPRAFPGLNGLGVWPFDKLFKKKRNPMSKRVMFVPSPSGAYRNVLKGSRRRRRRR